MKTALQIILFGVGLAISIIGLAHYADYRLAARHNIPSNVAPLPPEASAGVAGSSILGGTYGR